MKYLFSLMAIVLAISFCNAQEDVPSIELKPSSSDSARWIVDYYFGEVQQTARGAWDTLPNIVAEGYSLYRFGGYIGTRRIPSQDDLITDEVRTFVNTAGPVIQAARTTIGVEMQAYGANPFTQDTLVGYPLIGLYKMSGASCGMPRDTMRISKAGFNSEIVVWGLPDTQFIGQGQGIFLLGEGVISVNADAIGQQITAIRDENDPTGDTWRTANGCSWTRIE